MAVTTGGRPKPSRVVAYWPALMHRSRVKAKVLVVTTDGLESFYEITFPIRVQSTTFADQAPPKRKPGRKATGFRFGRRLIAKVVDWTRIET